jgi:hypothetical protein
MLSCFPHGHAKMAINFCNKFVPAICEADPWPQF